LQRDTKTGKNVPNKHEMLLNGHKISQMSVKYSEYINIFQSKALKKFTQIGIFGLEMRYLATLASAEFSGRAAKKIVCLEGIFLGLTKSPTAGLPDFSSYSVPKRE
jgi:hypothetical protein